MPPEARPIRRSKTKRAAFVVLLVCVVASLSANAFLIQAALRELQAPHDIRLDPAGLRAYAAERAKPAPKGTPLLVFFGDSRVAMWPAPSTAVGYFVLNRGVGYQTTAQLLLRLDADVEALLPAVVVVEAGINDLKTIADFPERRAEIIGNCEANLEQIVARCRRAGATVVLATVFGIGDVALWRRPFWSSDVSDAVREVNAFLPKLSGERVILFDARPVLADQRREIQRAYQLDHLHLSPPAYEALNRRLEDLLQALPK